MNGLQTRKPCQHVYELHTDYARDALVMICANCNYSVMFSREIMEEDYKTWSCLRDAIQKLKSHRR